jgi:sugar/nucleoside kinase (ribokinase family)
MNETENLDLIGIGSPLVDLVLEVDDAFLRQHVSGAKGGMELVEMDAIASVIAAAEAEPVRAAGGAASNTTVGIAGLGLQTAFIGCCGTDDEAAFYREALRQRGCDPRLIDHEFLATGRVLSLVTPDAQRTMRTNLGAAAALDPAAVMPELFQGARMVMLEGYTLFNPDLTRVIADAAKAAGCALALDLASFEVVQASKSVLGELLDGKVDLVFANEDEAATWHEGGITAALDDLVRRATVAVVKLGADGARIACGEERIEVAAESVEQVVDTTGAGDNWAAGFLAGYLRGLPLEICGRLGALAGAATVSVTGAQLAPERWQHIRGFMEAQV